MHPIKIPVYQTAQIKEFEYIASQKFGISNYTLMQRAGKAAFDFCLRRWPQIQKIAVFCGSGNNGGDGYIFSLLAHERGLKVKILQIGNPSSQQSEAFEAFQSCQNAGVPFEPFHENVDLNHPDLIVDAICGIGLRETLRADTIHVLEKIEALHVPILAIDIPTGIEADTGRVLGKALHASATVTYIGFKLGLLTGSGIAYTGDLVLNDLQLPLELLKSVLPVVERIQLSTYSTYLKPRLRDSHKGHFGHVLVIGGDDGLSGAPRMSGMAALRVGAGLVTIATQVNHAAMMNSMAPELMCYGIKDAKELDPLVKKADLIVVGPGLGQSKWSQSMWDYIRQINIPLVVDGDGLNLLAQNPQRNENWILTPHPGEAGRLLNVSTQAIQKDRLAAVVAMQKRYGGVCVLKGAGSLICGPRELPAVCDKGNPGMATAGMGDVLSGVVAGFLSQGIPPSEAAKLSVALHAQAGDLAARDGERGMIATDLYPYLRRLANSNLHN